MKYILRPARIIRVGMMLIFLLSFCLLYSQPAILNGIIINSVTGQSIIGARISAGNSYTYSVFQGIYSLTVNPAGNYPVICIKAGYADYSSAPYTFLPGSVQTLNIVMAESANPPEGVAAVIDSLVNPPVARISWQLPSGTYEILYDDGIQDNFTVWAIHGNMNAVKFTPAGYPARIDGGSVNIGNASNYPSGSNPFVPFQMAVYNAAGPGGTPGSLIGGPVDVIPDDFGWVSFTFSSPPVVAGGNYYLVMIQGGNAPNAAGLAVDETSSQFRSYSRFVTGSSGWIPANGNFMIRSVAYGSGGPLLLNGAPGSLTGYHIWRLRQGEEMNPAVWTDLGPSTALNMTDPQWSLLPCGPYRWAVKAVYSGNRFSPPSFSNVIGKCWKVPVRIDITLSCTTTPVEGTEVCLKNLVYTDTLYYGVADTTGRIWFNHVWKGSYELKTTRFGYSDFVANVGIISDTVFPVIMLQEKNPASGLVVDNKTLVSVWNRPKEVKDVFAEDWGSGSFATNGWSVSGGVNWIISTATGNPAPSAMFSWSPQENNYNESLTSRPISGENAPVLTLGYDIYLDSFGTTTMNQLAVELWDGASWLSLKNYNNQSGDIIWTTEQVDISAYAATDFKIRFRAYGENTYDINSWNVDNIACTGSENSSSASCVLGYYYYLDNVLCGFVQDTTYTIPSNLVQYGNTYSSCVVAAYGSGYSLPDCYTFTSWYLPPPTNLTGQPIENAAYLTWNMPETLKKEEAIIPPQGLLGYNIYRDTVLIHFIPSPDTLEYYDMNLYPDIYFYEVSAKYDLTGYGFPGQFDESAHAGPVEVNITYGRVLPFYEPWDQGTFTYNEWSFDPEQGNWMMDMNIGNPLPSAGFSFEPAVQNYSYALVSPILNAGAVSCANIWLDYDLRLVDHASNGKEHLSVELFYNDTWHLYANHLNNGNLAWTFFHLNISAVAGKAFTIRFQAHGLDTDSILEWNVDNINVYAVCNPPVYLQGDALGLDVHLTWSPPDCIPGHLLDEGFEESFFPPEDWTQVTAGTGTAWYHSDASEPWGVHSGNHAATVKSDYNHQDEWLIANDVYVNGDLTFWSYAFQGSVHGDHYLVQISDNNGSTWNTLTDMSALPPYPSSSGYNEWTDPYTFDLSPYDGEVVKITWRAYEENGQGLWYNWAIDDCSVGGKKLMLHPAGSSFLGYDIYRSDGGPGNFMKITGAPVQDTSYTDPGLLPDEYDYYITSVYEECSSSVSSDTIIIDVMTGITPDPGTSVTVFPNPASSAIHIVSTEKIERILLINAAGETVKTIDPVINTPCVLNIAGFSQGVYILKILTINRLYIKRIVIVQ